MLRTLLLSSKHFDFFQVEKVTNKDSSRWRTSTGRRMIKKKTLLQGMLAQVVTLTIMMRLINAVIEFSQRRKVNIRL